MLDYAFNIGNTATFLYLDLDLNTAYAAHYVYDTKIAPYYAKNVEISMFILNYFISKT